jgi:predicted Rossmann-fold nucleotide-binding protein
VKNEALADGMISREDVALLHLTDDPDDAVQVVLDCYEEQCAQVPAQPKKADAQ